MASGCLDVSSTRYPDRMHPLRHREIAKEVYGHHRFAFAVGECWVDGVADNSRLGQKGSCVAYSGGRRIPLCVVLFPVCLSMIRMIYDRSCRDISGSKE